MLIERAAPVAPAFFGRGEIRSLTGVRGLAATLVVVFHFTQNNAFFQLGDSQVPFVRWIGTAIGHGYLAVDLFFVLSGFVMAISYGGMFAAGSTWAIYRLFLMRRFARIYPLYLAITLATAAMLAVHARPPGFGMMLLSNVFLIQSWGICDSLIPPAWSISTEAAAYLLFPLLAAVALYGSAVVRTITALLAVTALLTIALLPTAYVFGRVGPLDAHDSASLLP
jgi:peptidoglycan/LPS O-acetylase OafA/YrhL